MNNFRIVKRKKKFYIQQRVFLCFWSDVKRNNNPAYQTGCPPFDCPEQAKEWLSEYVKFHTDVVYPIDLVAH